ncbi:SDR family NAD(P)-dependent oxidoreductase [Litoribacter ruber]|uniref:SDR family NAD(P)-dependent oxidoreductase n=1 Tax=Litoribacter ruber TaxID=702568 RepID=UPI001BDB4AE2|nr:SDR family NAD(P)-dependent oxidoreductase [Litoribacter ruber]MBT0810924.1 SDR family NAD(P)-dependent oxidoreductase [Litoribacter ruber]
MEPRIEGKTIIITGGSSGIGAAAARDFAKRGANVIITGRSDQTKQLAGEIGCEYHLVDYAKLSSVHEFANTMLANHPKIDVLINNVGGVIADRQLTDDGNEMTFQINHLGGFLLTLLLKDRLEKSAALVINTSSMANNMGKIKLKDLQNEKPYSSMRAYGRAKLMNILHAMEIVNRFENVKAGSFHPGVVSTGFAREGGFLAKLFYNTFLKDLFMISPEKGADTLIWMVTNPDKWKPGEYYHKRKPGKKNSQISDKLAWKLWERSEKLVKGQMVP